MTPQPCHFGPPARRLFGVHHPARGLAQAAVLMCPPLLHEHVRSYRFFAQLAERLADAGITCLRFDYNGTGDADGDDDAFTPQSALADIVCAAEELRRSAGAAPLVVLGVRASALFAARVAADVDAAALWAWQPVYDGRDYVDGLAARYRDELASADRFPARTAPAAVQAHDLMGFRLSAAFADELAVCRFDRPHAALPLAIVDVAPPPSELRGATHVALPASAAAWAEQIDLRGLIPLRDVEPAVQALLRELPQRTTRMLACG